MLVLGFNVFIVNAMLLRSCICPFVADRLSEFPFNSSTRVLLPEFPFRVSFSLSSRVSFQFFYFSSTQN